MIKIAICDDCELDRELIFQYVNEYCRINNIVSEIRIFDHPDTLISECEKFRPHIYILDIVMPMITGIEAARELRWNQKDAKIIFTTSESSFALESFDVNPTNYLLKPVNKDKLYESLELALKHIEIDEDKTITIKIKGGFRTLVLKNIMYLEYRNHIVTYCMYDGETVSTVTQRIGFTEYIRVNAENMPIVQCHESFAVNIDAVDKLTKTDVYLKNGDQVPVSKSRYGQVSEAYFNNSNGIGI